MKKPPFKSTPKHEKKSPLHMYSITNPTPNNSKNTTSIPTIDCQQSKKTHTRNHLNVGPVFKSTISCSLSLGRNSDRWISWVGTWRLPVRWRGRLIKTERQSKAATNVDIKGQSMLALNAITSIGEEIIRTLSSQRYNYGQRLIKNRVASVVDEGIVIGRVIDWAVFECCQIVGLDHRLIWARFENWKKNQFNKHLENVHACVHIWKFVAY